MDEFCTVRIMVAHSLDSCVDRSLVLVSKTCKTFFNNSGSASTVSTIFCCRRRLLSQWKIVRRELGVSLTVLGAIMLLIKLAAFSMFSLEKIVGRAGVNLHNPIVVQKVCQYQTHV